VRFYKNARNVACVQRDKLITEVDERIQWVLARENELEAEEVRLEEAKRGLEESAKKVQQKNVATTTTMKGSLKSFIRVLVFTHQLPCRRDWR
jgi:microcompartment protein CcmL/EutN